VQTFITIVSPGLLSTDHALSTASSG
jgi:hypothetical protein